MTKLTTLLLVTLVASVAAHTDSAYGDEFNNRQVRHRRQLANQRRALRMAFDADPDALNPVATEDLEMLPEDVQDLFEAAAAKAALDALEGDDDDDNDKNDHSHSHSSGSSSGDHVVRTDSGEANDDDDDSSTHSSLQNRRDARDARRIAQIVAEQAAAELDPFPVPEQPDRQSYQGRFIGGLSPRDDNLEKSWRFGSTLIISKTSANPVTDDSYDGDENGKLDVLEARDEWADTYKGKDGDEVEFFANQIRNRARSNGGSIALRGIVLTAEKQRFDRYRLLITPCFPIVFEEGFNVEIYVNTHGDDDGDVGGPALLVLRNPECQYPPAHSRAGERIPGRECLPSISAHEFFDVQGDGSIEWVEKTQTFTLERLQIDPFDKDGNFNEEANAEVFFERCTQFAYFA